MTTETQKKIATNKVKKTKGKLDALNVESQELEWKRKKALSNYELAIRQEKILMLPESEKPPLTVTAEDIFNSGRKYGVFYEVAKVLSFTKAAENLHMTQPAVTFQVQQIELRHGHEVFSRAHNKVELTKSGKILYKYLQVITLLEADKESILLLLNDVLGFNVIGLDGKISPELKKLLGLIRNTAELLN